MASALLDPRFKLSKAAPSEIEDIFLVMEIAYAKDEIWVEVYKNVKLEELHPWVMEHFSARWLLPDVDIYKITEVATGRIAGWTALQFPWVQRPISDEAKAMVKSKDLPPKLDGMNPDALVDFFDAFNLAEKYGYNPDEHYHRKGTMIHPDFQNQRLGTVLTQHCNAISDKTGGRTFVGARPTSIKMFNDNGFKTVGSHDAHLERWGGSREKSITYMTIRDAPVAE